MKTFLSTAALIAAAAIVAVGPAQAQQATASFHVSLSVEAACTVDADPLNFGTAGIIASNIDAQTSLTVQCTSNTPVQIGLSAGGSGVTTARTLKSGANSVSYQLYQSDPAGGAATVWGNQQGTDTVDAQTDAAGESTLTVYGRVPSGQNVPPGDYSDDITATVWYGDSITGDAD